MIFGKHINHYYRKYALQLIIGLIALGFVDTIQLAIPRFYQMIINGINDGYLILDGVSVDFDMDFLVSHICMPMVWIILGMVFGRLLWRVTINGAAIKMETDMRNRMFDQARHLSQQYYQVHEVGNLMSLFTNDLDTISECFGWGFLMFFDALFLGVLSILKMVGMDPLLTLLSLIPMMILMACATLVGKVMTRKWAVRQAAFSKLSDFSQESFSGIAVIKAFVKEAKELLAFRKLNDENEKTNLDFTRTAVLFQILVSLFVESVVCVILGYGGYLVYCGKFNAGQLVEFIGYFSSVVWPIMAVSELIDKASRGKASITRVDQLLDSKQDVKDRENVRDLENIRGKITFKDLNFRYPDGEYDALEHIDCTIEAGENVGLVGKTGCGKTTLVDLILRTYNVPDGSLFLDDVDVNTVSIRSVRSGCAYVPQDNFLFSDTISHNISFGVNHGSDAEIVSAARMADIDGNIQEFQDGYETILGERGVTVSGGQKQRISIARALMKDAPVLILDDSVSAVDTQTERVILKNLRKTRAGKTTILIAHRISTIEQMDKILFMEDGRLTAVGSHAQLYQTCESYRKMVDLQRLEEERGAENG